MCKEICSMELIRNASKYLLSPTETEEEGRRGWVPMEGMNGRMSLREKRLVIELLREVVRGGGEIEEKEEVMRGIEGVIREGRERGDWEGMLAEEEGERLVWVIEKKSRGREMKSFREIERMKEEEMKKRKEAERREAEEKRKREEEMKKRKEAERRETEEKRQKEEEKRQKEEERRRREELEAKLAELEKQLHPPTLNTLTSLSTTLTDTNIEIRGNTIVHSGSISSVSCTFNDELKNV